MPVAYERSGEGKYIISVFTRTITGCEGSLQSASI